MGRFVAASSPGEDRDLFLTLLFRIGADNDLISREERQTWMKYDQSLQHLFDNVFWTVNELFHSEANVPR
jgi:hypothetical protein